jgi:hypothetical protein
MLGTDGMHLKQTCLLERDWLCSHYYARVLVHVVVRRCAGRVLVSAESARSSMCSHYRYTAFTLSDILVIAITSNADLV